jgi:hypothetical protein
MVVKKKNPKKNPKRKTRKGGKSQDKPQTISSITSAKVANPRGNKSGKLRISRYLIKLDNEFNLLTKVKAENPIPKTYKYERAIQQVVLQRNFFRNQLASDEALDKYIQAHPFKKAIMRRIEKIVKAKQSIWRAISEYSKSRKTVEGSAIAQFRLLVKHNYVLIGTVFPEFEEEPSVCGLQELTNWYRSNSANVDRSVAQDLFQAYQAKLAFLKNRYHAITGQSLESIPDLDSLDRRKASLPSRLAWTDELYSLEAKQMNRDAALNPYSVNPTATNTTASTTGPATSATPVPSTGMCDVNNIIAIAGGRILQQPDDSGANLYSFPQKLSLHENVFYDYSVIIPIDDCLPCKDQDVVKNPRSLIAARVLSGKANTVLTFLDSVGLSTALGRYASPDGEVQNDINRNDRDRFTNRGDVGWNPLSDPSLRNPYRNVVQDIRDLLHEVTKLKAEADVSTVRSLKRRLAEMAGLMRLIGRTEAFLGNLATDDPRQFLAALRMAIDTFPSYRLKNTRFPTTNENTAIWANTLEFHATNFTYENLGNRQNSAGHMNVPDAKKFDKYDIDPDDTQPDGTKIGDDENGGWVWSLHGAQRFDLRNYIRFLGEQFYSKLNDLKQAAQDMATSVENFSGSYGGFDTEFQRLAVGVINDAIINLSLLLDAISAQLTLPVTTLREGSKRLALQMVFRQYWHPEGYVMGKLVGYKNLIPNQKETVKRQTFIKTSREVSTVEEFATERQNDQSITQKESAEITREMSRQFNFTQSATGHYDVEIWGLSGKTDFGFNLASASKSVQTMSAEAVSKSSAKYNDKREVKIRELTETENVQETTLELANLNQEITANYFYYQLLRQYRVTINLHDIRPVLLRARDVPNPAEVDDKFISTYGHILFNQLPSQLSADAQESADRLDSAAKKLIRTRTEMFQRTAEFETFRDTVKNPVPSDETGLNRYREEYRSKERLLGEARQAFIQAEEEYSRIQARMNRVVTHVRENINHYMQFIWHASPKVDQDMLMQDETFCGQPLPQVTRGLIRQGYFGNEEIFDYTGRSIALFDALLSHLTPGSEIASMPLAELEKTSLFQYLRRYYPDQKDALIAYIQDNAFVDDPADVEDVLSSRSIQVAQDALIVETMPGQVPLLEGFQMAHRMLDVQRACLENQHLNERIADRPWQRTGDDSYSVRRYDGTVPPQREVEEK